MKIKGTWPKNRVELLSLAAVGTMLVGLAAMTTVVYARLAEELAGRTRESIESRVVAIDSAVADVFSLAADESMNLMNLIELRGIQDRASVAEQLGTIQDGLLGCSSAWLVPWGGQPIAARGTSSAVMRSHQWWRQYLSKGVSARGGTFASLGIRRNIGFMAGPFRGDTGIGTVLPLVVERFSGTERTMTAFFELDLTSILDELMSAPNISPSIGPYPMELSFYDSGGVLIETTRNIPLVRITPFRAETRRPEALDAKSSLLDYLAPGGRSIEARWRDDRIGLVCVGRVPAALVMRDVRKVATYVLTVGAVAMGSVLALGILLLQAFRRARNFEKAQLLARFQTLQAKVNPHFLFNTLDSMIGVVEERDYDSLMLMLRSLSSMLHATVRSQRDFVTLREELEYVRAYLAIQKVRYREWLAWEIKAEDGALEALVCRFSVQPLAENCFTHGAGERGRGLAIGIDARCVGGAVEIEVADDGVGCDPETLHLLAESFRGGRDLLDREGGLFNVHDRARLSFGEGYGLQLLESTKGFRVRLRVPAAGREAP